MKSKSSWDMTKNETIFSKKERIEIYDNSKKNNSKHSSTTFICVTCGKSHSWSELGKKH